MASLWLGFARLRARLLLLITLSALPLLVLMLFSSLDLHGRVTSDAIDRVRNKAQLVAWEQTRLIIQGRAVMDELAVEPSLRFGRGRECEQEAERLNRALLLYGELRYTNVAVANRSGDIVCSAFPVTGLPSVADRPYFREAVRTGAFAVGEVEDDRITGRLAIVLSLGLGSISGSVERVLLLTMGTEWISSLASQLELPAGAVVVVVTPQGDRLARYLRSGVQNWTDARLVSVLLGSL
jgi:hypothetical protein